MEAESRILRITPSMETLWDVERTERLTEKLLHFAPLWLRIVGESKHIHWEICLLDDADPGEIRKLFTTNYMGCQVKVVDDVLSQSRGDVYHSVVYYGLKYGWPIALPSLRDVSKSPLYGMIAAMEAMQSGEKLVFSVLIGGHEWRKDEENGRYLDKWSSSYWMEYNPEAPPPLIKGFFDIMTQPDRKPFPQFKRAPYKGSTSRARSRLYSAMIMLESISPHMERVEPILQFARDQTNHFCVDGYNWRHKVKVVQPQERPEDFTHVDPLLFKRNFWKPVGKKVARDERRIVLSPEEVAMFWHLPDKTFKSEKIWGDNVKAEVSRELADNSEGFVFGKGECEGETVEVKIPEATLATHLSILGKSGMGKSTFLLNVISQTVAAGHGVAVLDPHGDLVVDILERGIPPKREKDVVVLDLSDPDVLIPFNVFSSGKSEASIGQISAVIDLAQKRSAGDQTARYLEQGLFAISHLDNPTMLDFRKFLSKATFRDKVLDAAHAAGDFDVVEFWEDEYNELTETKQRTFRTPIMNRIDMFSRNKHLRPMLCHPDGLPLAEWMDEKKIILLSLRTDPLKVSAEHRDLIGAIFISMLQMAGMNPRRQRTPFYIFADEMQRFKTPAFGVMFSEARKFNLSLTIAHQFTEQLDKDIMSAIIGNVGTKAIFGCGQNDARRMGVTVKDAFEPSDLERLDKYTMALRTVLDGNTQPSCLIHTLPPPERPETATETEQRIRALSKATYTPKTRAEVNQWLAERYPRRRRGRGDQPLPTEEKPDADIPQDEADESNDDEGAETDDEEFWG